MHIHESSNNAAMINKNIYAFAYTLDINIIYSNMFIDKYPEHNQILSYYCIHICAVIQS